VSDSDELLCKIQQDIEHLTKRIGQIEEDTGSLVMVQGRILNSLNDLQTSVLKVREALLRVREKLG
jgi:hypothetical protein